MWTFTNSFENLTFIFTFPEISPPAKALLFLNIRQWFNKTDKIILLCFASRFTEKHILFLKNFLCGIPSGHSSSQSGCLVALAAHPTWTCFPYTLSISRCVAVSWSWLGACRCYPNTYLHFSSSPKRWFLVLNCEYLGHCRAPSGGRNISTFLQAFTQKSGLLRGQNVCFTLWSHMTIVR